MLIIYCTKILIPRPTLVFSWNFLKHSFYANVAAVFYRRENNMKSGDNLSKADTAHVRWFITGRRENLESKKWSVHSNIIHPGLIWSNKKATKTLAVHHGEHTASWGHYAPREHLFKGKGREMKSATCFRMSDLPSWNMALPLLTGRSALQTLQRLQSLEDWAPCLVGWSFPW